MTTTTTSSFHTRFLTVICRWIKEEYEEGEDAHVSNPKENNKKETSARIDMTGCGVLAGNDYAIWGRGDDDSDIYG